ncbi:MAG: hypothetical protein RI897_1998 [Verrucomicrobiota bacterium]
MVEGMLPGFGGGWVGSLMEDVGGVWGRLGGLVAEVGAGDWAGRVATLRRLMVEQGFGGPAGGHLEGGTLELLPYVVSGEEWGYLEAGLLQRVELLNGILGDIYGTQRLVRDGWLPAPLVFANPHFLRSCQALEPTGGVYLQIYAADVARGVDGGWWVLADHTQAPAGLGYMMENRSLLSRVVPELLGGFAPRSIAETLLVRLETLQRLSPRPGEKPMVVLLGCGGRGVEYFEQAYLARRLGVVLAEGEDLTVRGRRLFLKTLDGLRRVDVVMRRLEDAQCDPLELDGASLGGVAGLVEAARAGEVTISNALGAGVVEGLGLGPFLPGLSRALLGEELLLPSPATWWCGQAREEAYVRGQLGKLDLCSAFDSRGEILAGLDSGEALGMLQAAPHWYVARERLKVAAVPAWEARGVGEVEYVLRVFVLHDGAGFRVVPGGVARGGVGGGAMRDVWVESDESVVTGGGVRVPELSADRLASDLPSRGADNMYWLGRYTERLEQLVRISRCLLGCAVCEDRELGRGRLVPMSRVLGWMGFAEGLEEYVEGEGGLVGGVFRGVVLPGVAGLVGEIHRVADAVRDRLSEDTWRTLFHLGRGVGGVGEEVELVEMGVVLDGLLLGLSAFSGVAMENMTRGYGWVFLDVGRRVERGVFVARLLEGLVMGVGDVELLLEPALQVCDSVMTHRRRFFSAPRVGSTLEVLAWAEANPRSLAFQVQALRRHALVLPSGENPVGWESVRRSADQLAGRLDGVRGSWVGGEEGDADEFGLVAEGLQSFSDLLAQVYFSHVVPRVT